jgi:large subunit ribosomal protein L13
LKKLEPGNRIRDVYFKADWREPTMKTYMANADTVERKWYVIDAKGKTLGRLSSEIAKILRGKNKPSYTPHVDTGDFVIVINAEQVKVTGKKADQKLYRRHSSYPGGLKEMTYSQLMEKKPTEIIRLAVKGMLPNNPLGRKMLKKLKVYAGPVHKHEAQKPELLEI